MLISIPDSNLQVLESLHTYKFLATPQFVRLGINGHEQSVQRTLRRFRDKNRFPRLYVDKKEFGFVAGVGNLHSVYYLTRHGAAILADYYRADIADINFPRGEPNFSKDYFHRWCTVDIHIALWEWAARSGARIEFVHTYFDHTGSNRARRIKDRLRPRTKIDLADDSLVPDMIYLATLNSGEKYLAVVEVHNGRDSGRFLRQMVPHAQALAEGAVAETYGLTTNNRVRWVFEHANTMNASIQRIRQDKRFAPLRHLIDFNTIENVREDFTRGWQHF